MLAFRGLGVCNGRRSHSSRRCARAALLAAQHLKRTRPPACIQPVRALQRCQSAYARVTCGQLRTDIREHTRRATLSQQPAIDASTEARGVKICPMRSLAKAEALESHSMDPDTPTRALSGWAVQSALDAFVSHILCYGLQADFSALSAARLSLLRCAFVTQGPREPYPGV